MEPDSDCSTCGDGDSYITAASDGSTSYSLRHKIRAVRSALKRDPPSVSSLRQVAISTGGLMSNDLRRLVWPVLVGVDDDADDSDDDDDDYELAQTVPTADHASDSGLSRVNSNDENCDSLGGTHLEQEDCKTPCATDPEESNLNAASTHSLIPDPVNIELDSMDSTGSEDSQLELRAHPDYQQVVLDVRRTLARFPKNMHDKQRLRVQYKLVRVIVRILVKHNDMRYYQGFHDVCLTVLLVLGREEVTFRVCERLAVAQFREFLTKPMERTNEILFLLYPLVGAVDPDLERCMWRADLGTMFALSWLITWFSHVLDDASVMSRLYDLFLATHPLMPLYIGAALILYRSEEVRACPPDMPSMHSLLNSLPDDLPMEALIGDATELFVQHPPSKVISMMTRQRRQLAARSGWTAQLRRTAVSMTFWAAVTGAAAYYVYNHYAQMLAWYP